MNTEKNATTTIESEKKQVSFFMRMLIVATAIAVVICIGCFVFIGVYMNMLSRQTISTVGELYMNNMGDQEAKSIDTAMSIKLEQVVSLARSVKPDEGHDIEEIKAELTVQAQARDFSYLGFYGADGKFEDIYGGPVSVDDPESFFNSITGRDKSGNKTAPVNKMCVGKDASGNAVVFLGIVGKGIAGQVSEGVTFGVDYEMKNGEKSVALVAGIRSKYVADMLRLAGVAEKEQNIYSNIIRNDGSFVIASNRGADNYYDLMRESMGGDGAQKYIDELSVAMAERKHYSAVMRTNAQGLTRIHCCELAYSEWYLVLIMDSDMLGAQIDGLSSTWGAVSVIIAVIIIVILVVLFVMYFNFNKHNTNLLKQARVQAEQANKAKSEFLSSMSHDIRTPMNAIVGMTAIATNNINDKQQVQNCLKKITLSSKHLLGLINDVLDMSKIESGKMTLGKEKVSLREVLDGIATIVQPQVKTKGQKFSINVGDIITESVYCDSVRLNQVLLNLLSNAVKFTPEGGTVSLSLCQEKSELGEGYVRIHVKVKDNGIGMTKEFQKRIFESFVREDTRRVHKTEGAGLGMAITKYIVDAMNGSIEIDSAPGAGTEFRITVDLEKAEESEEEMILPAWNMLVVDDDRQLCESAAAALKEIGVKAEWTQSGEDAVETAVARQGKNNGYDVVLIDWKLPGFDGLETARRLRDTLGEDIRILLMSAYDWGDMEEEARKAGISGFISKPLFKSTLYYGLKRLTGETESEKKTEEKSAVAGANILLAEDNDLNWEIAETLLSEEGFSVRRAENGKICLDIFSASAIGEYDAILMDIRMPVMTGYEAARAIRSLGRADKDIPIIAMTADAFAEDIKHCLDCGMNAHVAKPIDIETVKSTLEKFVAVKK